MTDNYLLLLAVLGWALTIYFGFYRYRQYVWTRRKTQYDLFTRINQRSDRLFLNLAVLLALPRKGAKGQAKFTALTQKYLESIEEKIILIKDTQLPEKLAVFWLKGILNELDQLRKTDPQFLQTLTASAQEIPINLLLEIDPQTTPAPDYQSILKSLTILMD